MLEKLAGGVPVDLIIDGTYGRHTSGSGGRCYIMSQVRAGSMSPGCGAMDPSGPLSCLATLQLFIDVNVTAGGPNSTVTFPVL